MYKKAQMKKYHLRNHSLQSPRLWKRQQPINVYISIRKRCLRDYNKFDCIVEVGGKVEAEVLNLFSVSSSTRPATKFINYGGISSIFYKSIDLIRNTFYSQQRVSGQVSLLAHYFERASNS